MIRGFSSQGGWKGQVPRSGGNHAIDISFSLYGIFPYTLAFGYSLFFHLLHMLTSKCCNLSAKTRK